MNSRQTFSSRIVSSGILSARAFFFILFFLSIFSPFSFPFSFAAPFFVKNAHAQSVGVDAPVITVYVNNPSPSPSPSPSSGPPGSSGSSGSGGGTVYGQGRAVQFSAFTSEIGTSSAKIDWQTSIPTISQIEWGTDYDGSLGTVSEVTYSTTHEVVFDNLTPQTLYYLSVTATSYSGVVGRTVYGFVTEALPAPVTAPPPQNVHDFQAMLLSDENVSLTWVNPVEKDFKQVHIRRGTRYFPTDPTEGYIVYDGSGQNAVDNDILPGTHYYYTAFSENTAGLYSTGALTEYVGTSFAGSSTPPLYGGTVSFATTTFSTIAFAQNNTGVSPNSVNPDQTLTLTIPADHVPTLTEQTILTLVQDGVSQRFLFSHNPDGSLSTVVPVLYFHSTSTPLTVDFLSRGGDVVVKGVLGMVKPVTPVALATISNPKPFFIDFFIQILLIIFILMILIFLIAIYRSRRE